MPIFIFGSPRSGITLLENILGIHPELAWLSQYNNRYPVKPEVSILNRLYNIPVIGLLLYECAWKQRNIGTQYLPIPTEAWSFWKKILPNFKKGVEATQSYPPCAKDMNDKDVILIRDILSRLIRFQGKKRFFTIYADFPRIDYLSKAFPDALFIHLVRDGRAVCESYYRVNQLGQYNSWEEVELWFNIMPESWREPFFNQHYNIFGFSVYRWMYYLNLCFKESSQISLQRYLQVSYEDIVKDPIKSLRMIQSFANLRYSPKIEQYIEKVPPINNNQKWRQALTQEQLDEFFHIVKEKQYLNLLREDI